MNLQAGDIFVDEGGDVCLYLGTDRDLTSSNGGGTWFVTLTGTECYSYWCHLAPMVKTVLGNIYNVINDIEVG